MKNLILTIFILCCFLIPGIIGQAWGLSPEDMDRIGQQTRQMGELGISETQAKKMLTQMVRNRFQLKNQLRAQAVVMTAARAGLPTEPLMSKAMEGLAKQAGEQNILDAMEKVRNRYEYAYQRAKSLAHDDRQIDIIARAMAQSLAAGMQTRDMDAVMAQLRVRVRQQTKDDADQTRLALQTMQAVRTMARLGVGSSQVSDTLCQALQNGYTDQEMTQLRRQMTEQVHETSALRVARQYAGEIGKNGNDGGSDTGSGNGSDNGSGNGSDNGSGGGSDNGSNSGSDNGAGGDSGSSGNDANGSNGGSDSGSNNGSDSGSGSDANGSDSGASGGSDSGAGNGGGGGAGRGK